MLRLESISRHLRVLEILNETIKNRKSGTVASGKLEAKDVSRLRLLETVLGQDEWIGVSDAGVTINGAKVVTTDIQCSNGVIHVIDSVILPR